MNKRKFIITFLIVCALTGCGQIDTYNGAEVGTSNESAFNMTADKVDVAKSEDTIEETTNAVSSTESTKDNENKTTTTEVTTEKKSENKPVVDSTTFSETFDAVQDTPIVTIENINEKIPVITVAPTSTDITTTAVSTSAEIATTIATVPSYVSYSSAVDWYSDSGSEITEQWIDLLYPNGKSAVISSVSELKDYLSPIYRENVLQSYLNKYDDNFFANNVLCVNSVFQSCGTGAMLGVNSVNFSDGSITIDTNWNYEFDGCYEEICSLCFVQVSVSMDSYNGNSVKWSIS